MSFAMKDRLDVSSRRENSRALSGNVCSSSTQHYGCACTWLIHNGTMKLRRKLILLALAPLVLVLCMIAVMVDHQSGELVRAQRD